MTDLDSLLSALDTIETFDPNKFPVTVLKDATTTAVRALSESNEDELFARFGRAVIIRMAQHSEPNKALGCGVNLFVRRPSRLRCAASLRQHGIDHEIHAAGR